MVVEGSLCVYWFVARTNAECLRAPNWNSATNHEFGPISYCWTMEPWRKPLCTSLAVKYNRWPAHVVPTKRRHQKNLLGSGWKRSIYQPSNTRKRVATGDRQSTKRSSVCTCDFFIVQQGWWFHCARCLEYFSNPRHAWPTKCSSRSTGLVSITKHRCISACVFIIEH